MRILFQYSGSQKHLLIAQSSLLLLLQISLFIILKFIKSQSQIYQSELLLQLISFTIPNLSCLLPIGPYLIHSNFLALILIPISLIPTSFTVDFHSNSCNLFCLFPTVPYLIYTLFLIHIQFQYCEHWLIVVWNSYSLGFQVYKIRKKCFMLLLTFYIMHHFYDKCQLANIKDDLLFHKHFS